MAEEMILISVTEYKKLMKFVPKTLSEVAAKKNEEQLKTNLQKLNSVNTVNEKATKNPKVSKDKIHNHWQQWC